MSRKEEKEERNVISFETEWRVFAGGSRSTLLLKCARVSLGSRKINFHGIIAGKVERAAKRTI